MKMQAETERVRIVLPRNKTASNHQKLGKRHETNSDSKSLEGMTLLTLEVRLPPSRTVRE